MCVCVCVREGEAIIYAVFTLAAGNYPTGCGGDLWSKSQTDLTESPLEAHTRPAAPALIIPTRHTQVHLYATASKRRLTHVQTSYSLQIISTIHKLHVHNCSKVWGQ